MKKVFIVVTLMLAFGGRVLADEGMWMLPYLQKLNIKDMKAHGLRLTAQDIYNANGTSLKDAIVIFGNGCTGEIVSSQGLLLTNHHCGYGNIQQLSSVENDYLKNGFWAMNSQEEIPAPGLSVKFIRHIDDVTDRVVPTSMKNESDRNEQIEKNITAVTEVLQSQYPGMSILIKSFFGGNQFIMFAIEQFDDVRLVGAPPTSIGKFGGDTDNWMWPRHTGDFSMFRVYSDKDGKPAAYSKNNVPYQSPAHLKVSLNGYKAGDYAMIMGFPGSTSRYMTSYEIDQTLEVDNPVRIFVRGVRQDILLKDMQASDKVRIQYASKYASSSNYWKNAIGMSRGLKRLNIKAEKSEIEARFTDWTESSAEGAKYKNALPLIKEAVAERLNDRKVSQYLGESMGRATEILSNAALQRIFLNPKNPREFIPQINDSILAVAKAKAVRIYKDYSPETDIKVVKAMFKIVADSIAAKDLPPIFKTEIQAKFGGNTDAYVDDMFARSVFATAEKFDAFLQRYDTTLLNNDPAIIAMKSVNRVAMQLKRKMSSWDDMYYEGHRLFVAGLLEMDKGRTPYPDANFTLRLTYGNVLPYKPADAVQYDYYTTLSGVMEKEDLSNPMEFEVPAKLKELYKAKDFGRYAYKGDIPVGFLSNNDITGGNSGSPVLNSKGELLGLAFDGNWEAMSGDIAFEPALQRTINVDIRYVLFVIDKFAGAGYLVDEMTLAK